MKNRSHRPTATLIELGPEEVNVVAGEIVEMHAPENCTDIVLDLTVTIEWPQESNDESPES